jgi:hypothetical protein
MRNTVKNDPGRVENPIHKIKKILQVTSLPLTQYVNLLVTNPRSTCSIGDTRVPKAYVMNFRYPKSTLKIPSNSPAEQLCDANNVCFSQ